MSFALLKPYRGSIMILGVLSIGLGLINVAVPQVYRFVFERLIPDYTAPFLGIFFGSVALICVFSLIINVISNTMLMSIKTGVAFTLRHQAMDGFLDYPYSFFLRHQKISLMSLVGAEMNQMAEYIWNILRAALSAVQLLCMMGFIFFAVDKRLFLLFGFVVVLYFFWAVFFRNLAGRYAKKAMHWRDRAYGYCYEIFPYIKEIKCYGLYQKKVNQIASINAHETKAALSASLFETLFAAGTSLPVRLAAVVIFIFGYFSLFAGEYGPSRVITHLIYASMIMYPVITLFDSCSACYFRRHVYAYIRPFLGLEREKQGGAALREFTRALRVTNLDFSYAPRERGGESEPVFRGLNMTIPAGTLCTVVGSSGCGKTTLISLLVKLLDPPRGTVFYDDADITALDVRSLRSFVGLVTQEPFITNDTLRANLDPHGRLTDGEILDVCRTVTLENLLERLPSGLDSMLYEEGENLSGGEKQRLVLARRLARGNRIIILDESTSALDGKTEQAIFKTIRRMNKLEGITFIIITHRLDICRDADRIFMLGNGGVVEEGTHASLFREGTRYHEFIMKSKQYKANEGEPPPAAGENLP